MSTILPRDSENQPIPALRLKAGGAHSLSISAVSTRTVIPFDPDTRVVGLYATAPVYLRFGDANVSASNTDHYFPADTYYDIAIGGGKVGHTPYLAILQVADEGTVYISEKV